LAFALDDFKNFIKDKPPKSGLLHLEKNLHGCRSDNFINELLKLNHFENIYDNNPENRRYPEIELQKRRQKGTLKLFFPAFPFKKEDGYEIEQYEQSPVF
jgi:hypothetical protein